MILLTFFIHHTSMQFSHNILFYPYSPTIIFSVHIFSSSYPFSDQKTTKMAQFPVANMLLCSLLLGLVILGSRKTCAQPQYAEFGPELVALDGGMEEEGYGGGDPFEGLSKRAPLDRSAIARFGKRASLDRSAFARFGKRAPLDRSAIARFGKRAPLDRSAIARFGRK